MLIGGTVSVYRIQVTLVLPQTNVVVQFNIEDVITVKNSRPFDPSYQKPLVTIISAHDVKLS